MKKIIYFDETSATDYIEIRDGGKKELTINNATEKAASVDASVGVKAKSHGLFPFLNLEIGSNAKASALSSNIVKTYISNTILTDFLSKISLKDNEIIKFSNLEIMVYPNSMAYMKMYTPYLKILKMQDIPFDFSELDNILEGAKGYYELLAKTQDNKRIILRFNIKAFRNNYGLSDILKMNLAYYSIEVGSYPEKKLAIQEELNVIEKSPDGVSASGENMLDTEKMEKLNVYDVILAGVEHINV